MFLSTRDEPYNVEINPVSIDVLESSKQIIFEYTLQSNADIELDVLLTVGREDWLNRPIVVNFDVNYFPMFTTWRAIYGVYDHVFAQSRIENYTGNIQQMTTREIRALIDSGNTDHIIILSSGLLPEELSPGGDHTALREWMTAGGTLIWIGDGLSYHIASRQVPTSNIIIPNENLGWDSSVELIGYNAIDAEQAYGMNLYHSAATIESKVSDALGLTYDNALRGALVDSVIEHDGTVLGRLYNVADTSVYRTAIAELPVGDGQLILFGDALRDNEKVISTNIVRILTSGIIFDESVNYSVDDVALSAGEQTSHRVVLQYQDTVPEHIGYYLREDDPYSIHSWVGAIDIPTSQAGS